MVTKKYGVDFNSPGGALTLSDTSIGTHESGWTITGEVHEDYYTWVNDFEATHPQFGIVKGNFEGEVVAETEEAFAHFWKHHKPYAWDYSDN